MIFPLIALAVSSAALVFVIVMGRRTRRYYAEAAENWERARRDWERAAQYSREATAIRAETETLRRQRRAR